MKQCKCGSYAFNIYKEDIDQGDLCDVHYWKEKALAQPEQEPVAWMMPDGKTVDKWALQFYGGQVGKPLYVTPPQRKPLSDEEMWSLWNSQGIDEMNQQEAIAFARAIEAAHGIKENT